MLQKPLLAKSHDSSEAARDARRFLMERVRADWDFPSIADQEEPSDAALSAQNDGPASTLDDQHAGRLLFEPVTWRERNYSSGNEDADSEDTGTEPMDIDRPADDAVVAGPSAGEDDIPRRPGRKRKREQMLEEETAWNTGLAHYLAERDAWTCARPAGTTLPIAAVPITPTASTAGRASDDSLASAGRRSAQSRQSVLSTPASSPPPASEHGSAGGGLMLPVAPRMLMNNAVRARIRPETYNEIYSKIIAQGRSPTVPINLTDVTRACVRGWIAEGNWPPKPGPPDPLMGRARRKGQHLRKGVEAVGRVFGLGSSPTKSKS